MRQFPTLDGDELDLDTTIHPHIEQQTNKWITLREDFAKSRSSASDLPWWLEYQTDNGPTDPTYEDLSTSGGKTVVKLDTGGANADDVTALKGPTINWDNWTEIRAFVWGATVDSPDSRLDLLLADADNVVDISQGIKLGSFENSNIGAGVYTGGTRQNSYSDDSVNPLSKNSYGFRLYENENGNGHSVDWTVNGEFGSSWAESKGWPNVTDLDFYISALTTDGSQVIGEIDGIEIQLLP